MNLEQAKIISSTTTVICMIFILVLSITYFKKKKILNSETKIYGTLLILNIASLITELIFYYFFQNKIIGIGLTISEKAYYICTTIWMYMLTIYNFAIVKNDSQIKIYNWSYNKKRNGIILSILTIILLISVLKIERIFENDILMRSTGAAPTVMFMLCISLLILDFAIVIKHIKRIEKRKISPLFLFILVIVIEMILAATGSELLLITLPMSLVSYMMYHTIENPDVKMLEEVQIAKKAAEKANSSKTEFLSNMSHEIRTPLNAIVGFSESLKDDNISPEVENKIDDIITASNNLLEIVNGILDISKIEANKLELVNKEYDIKTTIDELESLTKARIGKRDLELKLKIDPSLPRILYGDNSRLKQIILNLLTNAVKYTKEGYINFVVSSVNKDDTCRLIISIEDTGIGIKQENINKLFSKFERLDVEKQITIEGTGLGLAITKKLVDLMGGTIVAQSVYGKGSKFTVSIDQKIISMNAKEEEKTTVKNEIIDVNGARTLIVDDNELNIKVATTLLKKYNFTIDSCTNGQECIKKLLEDDSYDIIFLDDMMPQMSGKEVIKKLREAEGFNIPTIALTANAIEGMKDEYLECGFDDYISKPIERKEIERVIKTFLKSKIKENNLEPIMEEDEIIEEQPPKEISYVDCSDKHILLVDDSEIELKVTGNLLEKNKCQISFARSGSECIVKLIDKKYDLIIIDDTMPKLSGVDTIKNLEEIEGYETPIILLTNSKGQELAAKITSKFIIGYLRKPVDKYELNELLKKVKKNKGDK